RGDHGPQRGVLSLHELREYEWVFVKGLRRRALREQGRMTMEDAVLGHMTLARLALEEGTFLQGHSVSAHGVLDRALVAMINAGWAMLLRKGEPVNTHEEVIPALKR